MNEINHLGFIIQTVKRKKKNACWWKVQPCLLTSALALQTRTLRCVTALTIYDDFMPHHRSTRGWRFSWRSPQPLAPSHTHMARLSLRMIALDLSTSWAAPTVNYCWFLTSKLNTDPNWGHCRLFRNSHCRRWVCLQHNRSYLKPALQLRGIRYPLLPTFLLLYSLSKNYSPKHITFTTKTVTGIQECLLYFEPYYAIESRLHNQSVITEMWLPLQSLATVTERQPIADYTSATQKLNLLLISPISVSAWNAYSETWEHTSHSYWATMLPAAIYFTLLFHPTHAVLFIINILNFWKNVLETLVY